MPPYNPGPNFRRGNRRFGRQRHPITGRVTGHAGDDWPAPSGTQIPAAYAGRVVENRYQYNAATGTGWGWMVLLEHQVNGQTVRTRYAHMRQQSSLGVGSQVTQGQSIGEVGSTGGSTGPHLHFEVIVNGEPVAPSTFDFPDENSAQQSFSSWAYPFQDAEEKEITDPHNYYEALGKAESGFYPVGINGVWHGGIHFDRGTKEKLAQDAGVRCIADGEVVAYRINREYPVSDFTRGPAAYSTGFALVKHSLKLPPKPKTPDGKPIDSGNDAPTAPPPVDSSLAGAPSLFNGLSSRNENNAQEGESTGSGVEKSNEPSLTFYSLYIHLQDWKHYQFGQEKPRPGYWADDGTKWVVAEKAVDANPYDSSTGSKGIRVRQGKSSKTPCIGWLPPGTKLTAEEGKGSWRKIVSIDQGVMVADPIQTPSDAAPAGWIYTGELSSAPAEPSAFDAVHVLDTPVEIKAGDLVGYLGQYSRYRDTSPLATERKIVHIAAFSCDDVDKFIKQSRARAQELPGEQKKLLFIEEDAHLVLPTEPDQHLSSMESAAVIEGMDGESRWLQVRKGRLESVSRAALGNYSGDTTRLYSGNRVLHRILDEAGNEISLNDFNALTPDMRHAYPTREVLIPEDESFWIERNQLQGSPVLSGRDVPLWREFPLRVEASNGPTAGFPRVVALETLDVTVTEPDGIRWWQVEVGTGNGESRIGWAREKEHARVRLCSPWDWPGFDITREDTPVADQHAHSIEAHGETQPEEDFKATADKVDGSPLFRKVRKVMDLDGDDKVTRDEIRQALRKPWFAQALSHLIVQYESEWGGKMDKWTALDPHMPAQGKVAWDWRKEKERIESLLWWDDIAGKHDFPSNASTYHFHPIALIANFIGETKRTDLDDLIRRIGDIISHGEGGYESYNSGTKGVTGGRVGHSFINPSAGTVTGKTINQILATDALSGTDSNRMFATGKYQTIISTLRTAKQSMGLTGEEMYDADMQEKVFAEYLLEKAGGGALARFVKDGKGTVDDAQYAASKEWASIVAPAGRQIQDGRQSNGNMSYYESAANSANSVSTSDLRAILIEIQKNR